MQTLSLETTSVHPAPTRDAAAPRIDFIDKAKAVGIVLVVLAHAPGAPPAVMTLIYSFHMPLFFLLSGYLLSVERATAPWRETLRRAARTLLVPYVFFFGLSFIYWLATRGLGARAAKFSGLGAVDALRGLATGLSADLFINVALWFFPCLFLCQLVYAAARARMSPASLLAGFTVLAEALLLAQPWPTRLPWGLDIVWIALPFYAAGHWLRVSGWPGHNPGLLAPLLWALLWFALVQVTGRVDLGRANFGALPLLYLPCALAGIALVASAARLGSAGPVSRWLADNSLVIFPLHLLLINFLSGALQMMGAKPLMEAYPLGWWVMATLWGLAASVPAALLLKRHVPMLLGLRRGLP